MTDEIKFLMIITIAAHLGLLVLVVGIIKVFGLTVIKEIFKAIWWSISGQIIRDQFETEKLLRDVHLRLILGRRN